MRADQNVAGHGIGLSIVGNIVDAYHGTLSIHTSPLGGAEIRVLL
jgi:signal transduction histidine kinase